MEDAAHLTFDLSQGHRLGWFYQELSAAKGLPSGRNKDVQRAGATELGSNTTGRGRLGLRSLQDPVDAL
jgi:hypothetical protein